MKTATATVLSVVCSLAVFQSCNSLKCYQCHSAVDAGCDKLTNDQYLKDCPGNYDGCAMFAMSKDGVIDTLDRYCEKKGSKLEYENCSTDKCNGKNGVVTTNNTIEGDTLNCYQCSSVPSGEYHRPDCEQIDDSTSSKYLKECKSGEVCSTFASVSSAKTFQYLARGCSDKGYKLDKQVHCETDKCNGNDGIVATKTKHEFNLSKMFKHGF